MKQTCNKNDCVELLKAKGLYKHYSIVLIGGIDRFARVGAPGIAEIIRSWDGLYSKISAMDSLTGAPIDAVNPKGMSDEELIKLGQSK